DAPTFNSRVGTAAVPPLRLVCQRSRASEEVDRAYAVRGLRASPKARYRGSRRWLNDAVFGAVHESEFVKVCGRRRRRPCPARRQPASAKRQWAKSREVGVDGAAGATRV